MVAPLSSRSVAWCPAQGGCALQWQTLNDYGRAMPYHAYFARCAGQEGAIRCTQNSGERRKRRPPAGSL
ncbi:hypothetical protein QYS46_32770 [Klebsiella michiganensis]|nr:hypothetical protein [Klebsiella michiganensis]